MRTPSHTWLKAAGIALAGAFIGPSCIVTITAFTHSEFLFQVLVRPGAWLVQGLLTLVPSWEGTGYYLTVFLCCVLFWGLLAGGLSLWIHRLAREECSLMYRVLKATAKLHSLGAALLGMLTGIGLQMLVSVLFPALNAIHEIPGFHLAQWLLDAWPKSWQAPSNLRRFVAICHLAVWCSLYACFGYLVYSLLARKHHSP